MCCVCDERQDAEDGEALGRPPSVCAPMHCKRHGLTGRIHMIPVLVKLGRCISTCCCIFGDVTSPSKDGCWRCEEPRVDTSVKRVDRSRRNRSATFFHHACTADEDTASSECVADRANTATASNAKGARNYVLVGR